MYVVAVAIGYTGLNLITPLLTLPIFQPKDGCGCIGRVMLNQRGFDNLPVKAFNINVFV